MRRPLITTHLRRYVYMCTHQASWAEYRFKTTSTMMLRHQDACNRLNLGRVHGPHAHRGRVRASARSDASLNGRAQHATWWHRMPWQCFICRHSPSTMMSTSTGTTPSRTASCWHARLRAAKRPRTNIVSSRTAADGGFDSTCATQRSMPSY